MSTGPVAALQAGGHVDRTDRGTRHRGHGPRPRRPRRPAWQDVWHRYATDLGAEWKSGGPGPGFAPAQLRFANDARVEVLMPWDVEVNDFLARFLAANGPGPHHLTFKVPDLADGHRPGPRLRDRAGRDRHEPPGVDGGVPPPEGGHRRRRAAGRGAPVVDQPGTRRLPRPSGGSGPTARGPVPPASLLRVCHVVADVDAAVDLFGGLLSGRTVAEGTSDGLRWVDLAWPGPLGVRLVGTDARSDRRSGGRLARVAGPAGSTTWPSRSTEPSGVPGAAPATSAIARLEGADGTEVLRDPGLRQCRPRPGPHRRGRRPGTTPGRTGSLRPMSDHDDYDDGRRPRTHDQPATKRA